MSKKLFSIGSSVSEVLAAQAAPCLVALAGDVLRGDNAKRELYQFPEALRDLPEGGFIFVWMPNYRNFAFGIHGYVVFDGDSKVVNARGRDGFLNFMECKGCAEEAGFSFGDYLANREVEHTCTVRRQQ